MHLTRAVHMVSFRDPPYPPAPPNESALRCKLDATHRDTLDYRILDYRIRYDDVFLLHLKSRVSDICFLGRTVPESLLQPGMRRHTSEKKSLPVELLDWVGAA